jgi:hypothetical protein
MPTLSASSSVFQLAFGVNAVLPVLISGLEGVREKAADSLLRKIKEYRPEFEIKERDRIDFVEFTFRSSRGLRYARIITYVTVFISLIFCGLSLAALCWSALEPGQEFSSDLFFAFVGTTLIGGPLLYIARNRFLRWLYFALVRNITSEKNEALLFADCVDVYLKFKRDWDPQEQKMDEATLKISLMMWELRLMRTRVKLQALWHWVRSMIDSVRIR